MLARLQEEIKFNSRRMGLKRTNIKIWEDELIKLFSFAKRKRMFIEGSNLSQ